MFKDTCLVFAWRRWVLGIFASGGHLLFPVFGRSHAIGLFKAFAKIAEVAEANAIGNF